MHVTLLRSFRRTVGTGGEPDGLELGTLRYRYALMPFAGKLPRAEALTQLAALQAGLMTRQTGKMHSGHPAMEGKLKPRHSWLQQKTGRLILSALKPAEDGEGLILRLWNPTARKQTDTLTLWREAKSATLAMLNEDPAEGEQPALSGRRITVEAKPHQIVTVRLAFD